MHLSHLEGLWATGHWPHPSLWFSGSRVGRGEGNGNPLQYSCLENPTNGGDWWATYSPWGREESDTTEQLHFHFSLSCIREGNGNPLQCSCLENPRDGGAWWAAVYGVAQSWTRLKWLSSSRVGRICISRKLPGTCEPLAQERLWNLPC